MHKDWIDMHKNCMDYDFSTIMAISDTTTFCLVILLCMSSRHVDSKCINTANSTALHLQEKGASTLNNYCKQESQYELMPYDVLTCSRNSTVSVQSCNCATYNPTEDLLEVGRCLYDYTGKLKGKFYVELPETKENLTDFMCKGYSRTGTLCSKCEEGHYPLAYSFDMSCVECSGKNSNWWKLVLVAFLPLTVFYFVVLLFKINVTSSHLQGFVFYSQVVSMPAMARVMMIVIRRDLPIQSFLRGLLLFYGVWNLDFFRSLDLGICLKADMMVIVAFDVAVGVYPLLLMALTYFVISLYDKNFRPLVLIWRPFRAIFNTLRRNWNIRTSLIDSFATLFALTHVKFLSVTYDLLVPVQVYQLDSTGNLTTSWRLFYNASVPYFGATHFPYAILAIALILVFILTPVLLLTLYPFRWFQKLLNFFPLRWYILHTFVDAYQGHYKDGTQPGTQDCRWLASSFYILVVTLSFSGMFTLNSMFYVVTSMILAVFVILFVNVNPFKDNSYTNAVFVLHLGLSYVHTISLNVVTQEINTPILCVAVIVVFLPPVYISAIVLHWMYSHRRFGLELIMRFCAWRRGYQSLN